MGIKGKGGPSLQGVGDRGDPPLGVSLQHGAVPQRVDALDGKAKAQGVQLGLPLVPPSIGHHRLMADRQQRQRGRCCGSRAGCWQGL